MPRLTDGAERKDCNNISRSLINVVSMMMRVSMQCSVRISVTAQETPLATAELPDFFRFLELHRSEANLDSANDDK